MNHAHTRRWAPPAADRPWLGDRRPQSHAKRVSRLKRHARPRFESEALARVGSQPEVKEPTRQQSGEPSLLLFLRRPRTGVCPARGVISHEKGMDPNAAKEKRKKQQ
jgi:hypothetical protein